MAACRNDLAVLGWSIKSCGTLREGLPGILVAGRTGAWPGTSLRGDQANAEATPRAQGASQELGSLRMQTGYLPLHKAHDVRGAQLGQGDGSVAETLLEETADERHVVGDGGASQAARVL